ncbi:MAG: DUF4012 domain-containing protein [Patescibacteria group bacterium]
MSARIKKTEKVLEMRAAAPHLGEHSSPHVLDLRKSAAEKVLKKEVKIPLKEIPAPRVEIRRERKFSRLSLVRTRIVFIRGAKNFFSFFFRGPQKLFTNIGLAIWGIPRFFKFLRFAFADCKKLVGFGAVAFLFILPLQTFSYYESLKNTERATLRTAEEAYANLSAGSVEIMNADFSGAAESFGQAAQAFSRSGEEINQINATVLNLIRAMPGEGEKLEAGEALLFAGEKLTLAGENILRSLADFSGEENDKKLTEKLKILREHLSAALPDIAAASDKVYGVKIQAVPEDKQEVFQILQGKLPQLVSSIKNLISVSDLMIKFLGDEMDKRYLVVFQNPGEIRPTGGFIGSLALVDFRRGEIKNMEVPGGGSYDFQGSLHERVASPGPLQLINARWQLQDANWFFDFPTSAQKIKWFYEKSGGPTVDGVIALNADLVADLLAVVGPIEMPEYGKILNKENFIEEIQKAVEIEYDKEENKPKKILSDMAPKLMAKLFAAEPKQFGEILTTLLRALSQKEILLYSTSPEIEHEIKNFDWGGEIKSVPEKADYLAVVNTNIAGQKTDRVIKQTINLETNIVEGGYIKNKLTITRAHEGIKRELFTGVRNVDYLRVYVPLGSTLIYATGFEAPPADLFEKPESDYRTDIDLKKSEDDASIDATSGTITTNESGKTVFGNWVLLDPGETATVTLEYILPFRISLPVSEKSWWDDLSEKFGREKNSAAVYQLLVQKQSGVSSAFTSSLIFPKGWQPAWQSGNGIKATAASIEAGGQLNSDRFYLFGFTSAE